VAAAWAEGMVLPLAEALVDAQGVLADLASAPAARDDRIPENAGLTPRELEVVRLLADGRSDRQIGESLFISHRTVMSHVKHIMDKLDVESRTAAATMAVRRQLI
jgi:DNA-binding NarL/FixJ family response regulator